MAEELGVLEIALGVDIGELVSGLSKAQQVVAGFAAGVVELAKKAIEAAAEAQGAAARVAGVFGGLSGEVTEFSEKLGASAGRAASDIESMVATFGGMISPMMKNKEVAAQMSEGLTSMAVNLAKAAHISAEEAMGALQGGLAGHGRELARLGISMDSAALKAQAMHDKLGDYSKLSQAQKMMVAYQVIMAQQEQISARAAVADQTYDGQLQQVSAHLKEAGEAFGNDLLPFATKLLEIVNGLALAFSSLSPQMRTAIEAGAALAATIGAAATASAIFKTTFAEAVGEAASGFAEAAIAALPLLAAIGAAVLAVGYFYAEWKKAGLNVSEVLAGIRDSIMGVVGPAIDWLATAFESLWDGVKDKVAEVRDFIFAMIEGVMAGVGRLMDAIAATGHADWAKGVSGSMQSGIGSMENTRQGMTAENMGNGIGAIASKIADAASVFGQVIKEDAGDVWNGVKEAAGGVKDIFNQIIGSLTSAHSASKAPGTSAAFSATQFAEEKGASKGPNVQMQVLNSATGAMHTFNQAELDDYNQGMTELVSQKAARDAYSNSELDKFMKWQDDVEEAEAAAEQAFNEAQAKVTKDLTHSLIEGTGKLGDAISNAMKAAAAGGPMAGLASMGLSLLSDSQAGQQAMNVLNTVFSMFSNTIGQLVADVLPLLGTIQNLLAPVLSALGTVFQAIAPLFQEIGGFLQTLMPIFQALSTIIKSIGGVISTVVSVLSSILVPVFQALAPLFSTLGIILTSLAPVFALIELPLKALGVIFGALSPVFQIVGDIFRGVGIVIVAIILGLADMWNSIAGVISGIVNGIISAINWFIDAINSALGWLGVHINDLSKVDLSIDTTGLQNSLNQLTSNNYDASDSAGALAASADQAAAALTNLPQGYKIALTEFNNMNTGKSLSSSPVGQSTVGDASGSTAAAGGASAQSGSKFQGVPYMAAGGIVTSPTLAVVGESGPEAVVPLSGLSSNTPAPLPSGFGSASSGAGGGMVFNVTIVSNDPEKIWSQLQPVIQRSQMRRAGRPIVGALRFGLPSDTR